MSKIKEITKAIKKPLEKIQKKMDAKYGEGSSEIVEGAVVLSATGAGTVLSHKKRKEMNKKYKDLEPGNSNSRRARQEGN